MSGSSGAEPDGGWPDGQDSGPTGSRMGAGGDDGAGPGSNPVQVTRMSGPDEKGVHALAPAPREPAPASTPRQIAVRRLAAGAVVAGIVWQALLAAGGYLVGHNLWHATVVYGFFAVVLGLLSWAPAPEDHHAAFRLAGSPRWPPAGGHRRMLPVQTPGRRGAILDGDGRQAPTNEPQRPVGRVPRRIAGDVL